MLLRNLATMKPNVGMIAIEAIEVTIHRSAVSDRPMMVAMVSRTGRTAK